MLITSSDIERFESKVKRSDDPDLCDEWLAGKDSGGYGTFHVGNKTYSAHRFAWIIEHKNIPEGKQVLHSCDNRGCVKTKHMFLGTNLDNMRDRHSKGRDASHKGELNGRAILTESEVLEIRALLLERKLSQKEIADLYGINPMGVSNIKLGKSWSEVK